MQGVYTTIRFTVKAIKSAPTELKSIAESYNQGIVAMPKRGYGVALQEDEIYVIYEARPEDRCMTSSQIHDKYQKLGKAGRDIMMKLAARATWPPSPATAC